MTSNSQLTSERIMQLSNSKSKPTFDLMALYGKPMENVTDNSDMEQHNIQNETGKGIISIYSVMSGIKVVYNDIRMSYCNKHQDVSENVIEINHCRDGRYECNLGSQICCYMSPGDFSIGALNRNFTDSCFPTNHYYGISIFIEVEELSNELIAIMDLLSIDIKHITSLICNENNFFIMRANESIEHIFSELYSIRENRKLGYLKIKVLELLLFLSDLKEENALNNTEYLNRSHVLKIKQIHDYIISDIKKHYTIKELSEIFELSPTALKKDFSKVYGSSVYTYLKIYRLQQAQKLLFQTEYSIAEIAAEIGYENPNKFSTAFKNQYGVPPTEFRKYVRLGR